MDTGFPEKYAFQFEGQQLGDAYSAGKEGGVKQDQSISTASEVRVNSLA